VNIHHVTSAADMQDATRSAQTSARPLPTVNAEGLSKAQFWNDYVRKRRPCVLLNVDTFAELAEKWTDEYLQATIGDSSIPVTHSLGDRSYFRDDSAQLQRITFSGFLKQQRESPRTKQYILVKNMKNALPRLYDDVRNPDIIAGCKTYSKNFWYGTGTNRTELHFDFGDNLLGVLRGAKQIQLFSPSARVRPYHWTSPQPANFSPSDRADRFSSDKLPEKKIEFTLSAGEVLYLPTGWWHRIDSNPGVAVNIWWSPGVWPLMRTSLTGSAVRKFILHMIIKSLRLLRKMKDSSETALDARVSFDGKAAECKITSLSLSGCTLHSSASVSVGSSIELKLPLPVPGKAPYDLSLKGVVRRTGVDGTKIEFDPMSSDDCYSCLEFFESIRPADQRWGAVRLAQ
jgi:hypothetical protein